MHCGSFFGVSSDLALHQRDLSKCRFSAFGGKRECIESSALLALAHEFLPRSLVSCFCLKMS